MFTNTVINLNIEGYKTKYCDNPMLDKISNIVKKIENHPIILKIKEKVKIETKFHFSTILEASTGEMINTMAKNKPTTYSKWMKVLHTKNVRKFGTVKIHSYGKTQSIHFLWFCLVQSSIYIINHLPE